MSQMLVLVVGGIKVDKELLDFSEMETEQERETYQNNVANELKLKHLDKISMADYQFEIYVQLRSKEK